MDRRRYKYISVTILFRQIAIQLKLLKEASIIRMYTERYIENTLSYRSYR